MALRLSLVIDGNPEGAKKALEDTAAGIEKAGDAAERAGKKFDWLEPTGESARKAAEPVKELGKGLQEAAEKAPDAAAGVGRIGEAAGTAGGKLISFRGALLGLAGGAIAGLGLAAAGAAFEGLTQAAGAYFRRVISDTERINEDLERHEGLLKRIRGAWDEAAGGASSYGNNARSALLFAEQQNIARLRGDLASQNATFAGGALISPENFGFVDLVNTSADENLGPFREQIEQIRQDLREGKADIIAFREQITTIAADLPADSPWRGFAEDILDATQKSSELQAELQRSIDVFRGLAGNADAAATALGGSAGRFGEIRGQVEGLLPALREYEQLQASIAGGGGVSLPGPATVDNYQPFAAGGWTGPGGKFEPKGIVHGDEFVFSAEATRAIGVSNLDALHRAAGAGFAYGGFAGGTYSQARGPDGRFVSAADLYGETGDLASAFSNLQGTLHQFGAVLIRAGSASEALESVFNSVTGKLVDRALSLLDRLAFGGGSSGGLGFLGSLFGLGGGGFTNTEFAYVNTHVGLFDEGGWTGPGGKFDPRGIVHAEEFVFSAEATRAIGVPKLNQLHHAARHGFAEGGFAGSADAGTLVSGSGGGGRNVIEVRLSADLEARIVQQATNNSIEIVQEQERLRDNRYENGGAR